MIDLRRFLSGVFTRRPRSDESRNYFRVYWEMVPFTLGPLDSSVTPVSVGLTVVQPYPTTRPPPVSPTPTVRTSEVVTTRVITPEVGSTLRSGQ